MASTSIPVGANESQTRSQRIDLQLARAGWTADSRTLIEEYLLSGPALRDAAGSRSSPEEFADYVLLDRLQRPAALVEAKRSSRSPLEGERQAGDYADRLKAVSTEPCAVEDAK